MARHDEDHEYFGNALRLLDGVLRDPQGEPMCSCPIQRLLYQYVTRWTSICLVSGFLAFAERKGSRHEVRTGPWRGIFDIVIARHVLGHDGYPVTGILCQQHSSRKAFNVSNHKVFPRCQLPNLPVTPALSLYQFYWFSSTVEIELDKGR